MSDSESSGSESPSVEPQSRLSENADIPSASTTNNKPTRQRFGDFQPPRGFSVAHLSDAGIFDWSKFKKGNNKELWAMRIPEGISPSQLDGLVLKVPSPHSPHSTEPLASFTADNAPGSSHTTNVKYELRTAQTTPQERGDEDPSFGSSLAGGAADGVSQLISMAERRDIHSENGDSPDSISKCGAGEMESFYALLPKHGGKDIKGHLSYSRVPIRRHLYLQAAMPAQMLSRKTNGVHGSAQGDASDISDDEAPPPKKRRQPWEKLGGFFYPAGAARTTTSIYTHEDSEEESTKGKEEGSHEKRDKKHKKRKSDEDKKHLTNVTENSVTKLATEDDSNISTRKETKEESPKKKKKSSSPSKGKPGK